MFTNPANPLFWSVTMPQIWSLLPSLLPVFGS